MARKGLRTWIAFLLSALMLLTGMPQAVVAAEAPPDEGIQMLMAYGIVQGDPDGNLRLNDPIKRAEVAAIAVRSMGLGDYAKYITETDRFKDMKGYEWAIGYVTLANDLGLVKGRGGGIFDPDAYITYAEVYTILLRMVRMEPEGAWNPVVIMAIAKQLGIAPGEVSVDLANQPALRGTIFRSLAKTISEVKRLDGKTILQAFVDRIPPMLTVDSLPETTASATITVSGTVDNTTRTVTVNGEKATLSGNRFTATVSLSVGANTLNILASDWAGNTTTKTVTITRTSNAVRISVPSSPIVVKPGESTTIKATAYDAANRALPADAVTAKVSGSVGTYDVVTGVFKAGTQAGKATITFTSGSVSETVEVIVGTPSKDAVALRIQEINTGNILSVNKAVTVKVEVVDEYDEVVTSDYGRKVTLTARDLSGVTISPTTTATVAGVATFTVTATQSGEGSLYATSSGLISDELEVSVGSGTRIVLSADPAKVPADGYSNVTVRATLVDDEGNPVVNKSGSDIEIELDIPINVDSVLTESYVVIPEGRSTSYGYDGELVAGTKAETVKVTGEVISKHNYPVVSTTVTVTKPTTGSAKAFVVDSESTRYTPGETAILTVRVVDANGNIVLDGKDYAFQVQVSTSNNEPVDELSPDLELTIGGYTPIKGVTNAVIARTERGVAQLQLKYIKSGTVTVKIVGVDPGDEDAIDDEGELGAAVSGKGLSSDELDIRFIGQVAKLILRVDLPSQGLTDQPIGVLKASQSATIKAYAVDANGGVVTTYNGKVTLERNENGAKITSLSSNSATAQKGVATFTIKVPANETDTGVEIWTAKTSDGKVSEAPLRIAVNNSQPYEVQVRSMYGVEGGPGQVALGDDSLNIVLGGLTTDQSDPRAYGYVQVYRDSQRIYTSEVLDLSDDVIISVPKDSNLKSGMYSIRFNNGVGYTESDKVHVRVESAVSVKITKVRLQAGDVQDILTVTFSGISATQDQPVTVYPEKLFLRVSGKPNAKVSLADLAASCPQAADSTFTCTWKHQDLAAKLDTLDGTVYLDTEDGFMYQPDTAKSATRDTETSDNYVRPWATIQSASITFSYDSTEDEATLTLLGNGFDHGNIFPDKLMLGNLSLNGARVTVNSASKATLQIKMNVADLQSLGPDVSVTAETGWLVTSDGYSSFGMTVPVSAPNPLDVMNPATFTYSYDDSSGKATLTLTLTGKGLPFGTVHFDKLSITDLKGNPPIQPSLLLSDFTCDASTGTEITCTIEDERAETLYNNYGRLGKTLFLTGASGWFATSKGWLAAEMLPGTTPISWSTKK